MQIAASVGDGHTGVHLPQDSSGTRSSSTGSVATCASSPSRRKTSSRAALGARVVAIGGVDIAEVQARVRGCFPSAENENEWYVLSTSPAFLVRPEVLHALAIVPDLGAATFTFEDDQGKRFDRRPDAHRRGSRAEPRQWAQAGRHRAALPPAAGRAVLVHRSARVADGVRELPGLRLAGRERAQAVSSSSTPTRPSVW